MIEAFRKYRQFIICKDKLPVDHRTGEVADAHDSNIWLSADEALALASRYNIGFVFTNNDPFWFIDIDKCLLDDDVTWSPLALDIVYRLPGAAVEVSISGRGLHLFGSGTVPEHACKNTGLNIELYHRDRFVVLTGTNAQGDATLDFTDQLPDLINTYFPPQTATPDIHWTHHPVLEWSSPGNNDEIIKKALASSSAAAKFGNRASFKDLWENNVSALSQHYPDPSGKRPYDASSVDAALAQHLAFWTGKNCQHILDLMWCSSLVRDKWTKHKSYLQTTITRAVSTQRTVYSTVKTPVKPVSATVEPVIKEGFQYLPATQQLEHFKGCVYIQDVHRIFTPSGALLRSEQFNATYGGYIFQLDDGTNGKTTKKAWEAFTESQIIKYPIADTLCFRPDLEQGALINDEGRTMVNTYVPIETKQTSGDPEPFLEHLRRVLPEQHDREILLAYMAACVQYKGVKFQWAPLLQGVEGNGKTLFTRCVAYAVGKRYTHSPKADDIDNKFNGWMLNKLFIGVEDIYVPDHRREVIEALKPMITNDELEIQLKGIDQVTMKVCANFMLNCNDKSGFRKTRNDRRFAVFYTAQQTDQDLVRSRMNGDYFPKLYKWLREGGYAIVNHYLHQYQIPDELNPATHCHRAPDTTTTLEAIATTLGGIEQEVLEAVDEGRQGFAGGWISSMAFDKLLAGLHASRRVSINKRRELLQGLGYDWHPALRDGRVNNIVLIDGGKPRLFIRDGHIHQNLKTPAEVTRAYTEAQGGAIVGNAGTTGNTTTTK